MKFICSIPFCIAIFILFISSLHSQNIFDVRSMSMGNTSVSNSYDLDAFNQNPANILNQRLNNNSFIYFNVLTSAGLFTNSDYLSLNFYDDYFTKDDNGNTRYLTDNDKTNILNEASDQQSNYLASAKILSVIVNTKKAGTLGLSIDERTNGNFIPSKDFLDLGLYGNTPNKTYDLSENEVNAYWIRELNISYAKKLKLKSNKLFDYLSLGISVKPQFGLYYLNTQQNNLSIFTNDSNVVQSSGRVEFLYSGLTDNNTFKYSLGNAGFGFGFDLGVNARLKNVSKNGYINLGLSITDLGYITWNKNTNKYFNDGSFIITDITQKSQIDSLKDIIKGTKTPVADFTTSLSPTLRLGVSYKIIDRLKNDILKNERATFAVDYVQGLNADLGGTDKPIIGIGGEYNITKVISPRLGFAFGGLQKFVMSIGLGVNAGPVIIDIGTYNIASLFEPKGTSRFSMGFGIKFKVR